MPQTTTMVQDTVRRPVERPVSRRMLLAGSAGLVGAAAVAARPALAQGSPPASVLPIQAPVRQDWLDKRHEEIIEPGLPIVDPHHHLWDRPGYRYLFPELLADVGSGHNIRATCYEQAREMYRADGPDELKSLGETEFVSGVSAMSASGKMDRRGASPASSASSICGSARAPRASSSVTSRFSDGRVRGIRNGSTWSDDPMLKTFTAGGPPGLLLDKSFREGFANLAPLGLTFDGWMFQTQLKDLADLARTFPETTVVLNHCGGPLAVGPYAGKREEAFTEWRDRIREVASFPNTYVKLGGLGMRPIGYTFFDNDQPPSSQDLEKAWRPYIETCITAFGTQRSMFESNFPVDKGTCSYQVLWNAFKRIAAGYSADEKTALFSGAASKAYRLAV
jgi:predicted TIM-barrel fold metal-dependent hydrolase